MLTGPIRIPPVSPSAGGGDALSALLAGRVVEARLSLALSGGMFRFATPEGDLDLPLPRPLPPGTRVSIAAQPGGGLQITVLDAEAATQRPGVPPREAMILPALNVLVKPANGEAGLPPVGRNVAATVIANPALGIVRVQAPGGEIDLPLARAVPEGTVIRLTAQRGGAAQVHVPAQSVAAAAAAPVAAEMKSAATPSIHVFTARPAGPVAELAAGQVATARAISSTPDGVVRLAGPDGVFDLALGKPLPPGTEARLAVQPGGSFVVTVRADALANPAGTPVARPILVPPGPQIPVLPPGAVVTARVTASAENGVVRFSSPLGEFQFPAGQPLLPGTMVRMTAQPNGALMLMPELPGAPPTPAEALQQGARTAAARQGGMAPLFADLEDVPGRADLPREVRQAAQNVLDRRLPLESLLKPEQIARAIASSGLLAEKSLPALGALKSAPADLKLALFVLRAAFGSLNNIRTDMETTGARLPPPQPGTPPAAQPPAAKGGQGAPAPAEQLLPRIASETEAALSRITLHQIASLPDDKAAMMRADQPDLRWSCEVPVNVDGRTAMFGFVIERDGHRAGQPKKERKNWRVRAALDLNETGAVEADVRLSGETVSAGLLAERPETAALLEAALPVLRDGLVAAGFEVEALSVRSGKAVPDLAATPGHFMDLRS